MDASFLEGRLLTIEATLRGKMFSAWRAKVCVQNNYVVCISIDESGYVYICMCVHIYATFLKGRLLTIEATLHGEMFSAWRAKVCVQNNYVVCICIDESGYVYICMCVHIYATFLKGRLLTIEATLHGEMFSAWRAKVHVRN
jgi:hypothetical protein